ncbi:16S rRNA (cytidine(1402)-2'-O)-methyltransferase [Occallatibacter savannae]|uniref:16S rRNA (cytidine(1402)-2'-O)-methyltransferase n=1 Tax=Occallatibacter savannae TaxID=1002691 RepID=UPI000D69F4C2|nr:16S rRNA (cytidine(1402)-2'-O)-methyltransferase [Occallatibacter savannae]
MPDALAPGLYLVATPIGNLGDITLRALEVLKSADSIACEDTRQTQKLLNHYGIATPTISYHEHNELDRAAKLIEELKSGARIAIVSDAGTPGISDPGSILVREAIAAGVPVVPIPGASAAITALIASGLPADEFHFIGFLPEKAGARRTRLEALVEQPRDTPQTVILYEAPHRIADTLADIEAVFGPNLRIVAARELTKLHEEFLRGTVAEVHSQLEARDRIRGEFVLLLELSPQTNKLGAPHLDSEMWESISTQINRLQSQHNLDEKEALKRLARELGKSKSELYRELQRERAKRR